jgi:hypothetical protein
MSSTNRPPLLLPPLLLRRRCCSMYIHHCSNQPPQYKALRYGSHLESKVLKNFELEEPDSAAAGA